MIRIDETALRILAVRRGLSAASLGDHCVERAREPRRLLTTHGVEPLPHDTEQENEAALAAHDARWRASLAAA